MQIAALVITILFSIAVSRDFALSEAVPRYAPPTSSLTTVVFPDNNESPLQLPRSIDKMLRQGSQLPELQSDSAHAPRLVLYQQTHHTPSGEPISILPLIQNNTGVTHLYIAAVHLNEPPGNITLNEHRPDDPRYDQLWREVRQLQEAGVKVMIMLGGAARGSFQRLDGSQAQVRHFISSSLCLSGDGM